MANELIMSDLSTISMKFFNSATVDMIFPKIVNRKNTISSVSDLSLKLSIGDHFMNLSKESTLNKVGGGSGSGCGYVGLVKMVQEYVNLVCFTVQRVDVPQKRHLTLVKVMRATQTTIN